MADHICRSCGAVNQLGPDQTLAATRCSSCGMPLEVNEELRYYIAQGENIQGPYMASRVKELVASGQVRGTMQFSLEGGPWQEGSSCPELFPRGGAGAPDVPAPDVAIPPAPPPPGPSAPTATPSAAPTSNRRYSTDAAPALPYRDTPRRNIRLQPHRGTTILVLGICGLVICGPLGIAAWVMGNEDISKMNRGVMDPSGQGTTNAGRILGIIATVFMIIGVIILMIGGFGASQL